MFFILKWIIVLYFAVICLAPLIWVILSSFKTNAEILSSSFSFPAKWTLSGYVNALKIAPIFYFYINSIIVTFFSVIGNILFMSMGAYVLARFNFKYKNILIAILALSLLVPITALLMPIYFLSKTLHLYDTKLGLIFVYMALGLPVSLFVLRSFFMSVPRELEEAAYIDGASFFTTFIRVVLPVARPGIAAAAILQFILSWNEFLFALVLTQSGKSRTLPLALNYFTSQFTFNFQAMFAALVMALLPSLLVYIILQEKISESLTTGALKG